MLYEIARDLLDEIFHIYYFVFDLSLLLIFFAAFFLTFSDTPLNKIIIPFCILVLGFVTLNWVNMGGVSGYSEYNMIGVIVLIGLLNRKTGMRWLFGVLMISQIVLVLTWAFAYEILEPYVMSHRYTANHFLVMVIVVSAGVLYLMNKFDQEQNLLRANISKLEIRQESITSETQKIQKKKDELSKINTLLESKIAQRKSALELQNKMIEEFIVINAKEFDPPLQSTLSSIERVKENKIDSAILNMLIMSGNDLKEAYKRVISKINHYPIE